MFQPLLTYLIRHYIADCEPFTQCYYALCMSVEHPAALCGHSLQMQKLRHLIIYENASSPIILTPQSHQSTVLKSNLCSNSVSATYQSFELE